MSGEGFGVLVPIGMAGDVRLSDARVAAGVIGFPIAHSLSPVTCQAAFDKLGLGYRYAAFEVPLGKAAEALADMRARQMLGLSVTMPHKAAVVELVDELSDAAQALGAVNCVARRGDRLVGHNTDGAGFCDALEAEGVDLAGLRCAVLGAGGAGRAVIAELARREVAEVAVIARSIAKAESGAALAGKLGVVGSGDGLAQYDLIVNATPVGMAGTPDAHSLPLNPELLHSKQRVVDLVYNPVMTPLLAECVCRKVSYSVGVGMLVYQAAHAVRIWTAQEPPIGAMTEAARAELSRREWLQQAVQLDAQTEQSDIL